MSGMLYVVAPARVTLDLRVSVNGDYELVEEGGHAEVTRSDVLLGGGIVSHTFGTGMRVFSGSAGLWDSTPASSMPAQRLPVTRRRSADMSDIPRLTCLLTVLVAWTSSGEPAAPPLIGCTRAREGPARAEQSALFYTDTMRGQSGGSLDSVKSKFIL